jgi:hypothetical protein
MMRTSRNPVTPLVASSVRTTPSVGTIGVRPASTTKVMSAESSAASTAASPSARAHQPAAGAALASSMVVD